VEVQEVIEKILNGVAVVTTRSGGNINGLSIAWMSQVSMTPPLVMVAMAKGRYTHELIEKSNVFAINILSDKQMDIAKHFGLKSGRTIDKFESVDYNVKKTGSPILKNCLAYLDCEVYKSVDIGEYTIFVGEVVDAEIKSTEPSLIYNSRDYY